MDIFELELTADHLMPARSLWRNMVVGLWFLVLLATIAVGSYSLAVKRAQTSSAITIALDQAPPPVELLILKQVSQETAKTINAAVPLTTAPVPAASPFQFRGSSSDSERAIDCLASAIYYEAAAERIEGQMAVAQVVLNRVRHPAYPRTVCGVVYQGQERSTGCQFSFSCDGSMARVPSDALWTRLRALARSMLSGSVYQPVGWATHYHTDWVLPAWSAKLDKVRVEATHLFFRWAGVWGTAPAFRGVYSGGEPNIPKLARLSAAHRTGDPSVDGLILDLPMTEEIPGALTSRIGAEGNNGEFIIEIDRGVDPSYLPILAERTCGNRDYCKLIAWTNAAQMPKAFPVGEAAIATSSFSFLRNRAQNFEKSLWNCAQFPRSDRKQCMRKRVMIEGKAEDLIPVEPDATEPAPATQEADVTTTAPPSATQPTGRRRPGTN
jgi:spore germination cell wall hydrolase CwlJ-like protein